MQKINTHFNLLPNVKGWLCYVPGNGTNESAPVGLRLATFGQRRVVPYGTVTHIDFLKNI